MDVVEQDESGIGLTKYVGNDEETITKMQHDEIPKPRLHENEGNDEIPTKEEQPNVQNQNGTGNEQNDNLEKPENIPVANSILNLASIKCHIL